jgi:hypothetical protein
MNWKRTKFDCHFTRYTSGEYEIVMLYETLPNGDTYQLNKAGYFLATGKLGELKTFAEEHNRFN